MRSTEKRRSVRVPVDFPATIEHLGREHSGRVLNLSVDGALLSANQLLDAGEQIQLAFEMPEGRIYVKGTIIWAGTVPGGVRTIGMGVSFDGIPAVQQAAIELFIRNLLKI